MNERRCTIDGCDRPLLCKGVCNLHYKRIAAHGDPQILLAGGDEVERFWRRVRKTRTCWIWTGGLTGAGYGIVSCEPRKPNGRLTSKGAHRYAYELLVGPIPEGLVLDHLCRVPACVNPSHLEPVTPGENARRGVSPIPANALKTECAQGHPFDEDNTRIDPKTGHRSCWTCRRERSAAHNAAVSAQRSA